QRDDVRVLVAADPVLRDLGAGNHEHPVALERPLCLRPDIGDVGGEVALAQAERSTAQSRQTTRPRQQVFLHQDVIGDGDDVELPRLAIEINHFADRELAVAPLGVDVEVAQEEWLVPGHQILTSRWVASLGRWCSSSDVKLRTYRRITVPFPIATYRRAEVCRKQSWNRPTLPTANRRRPRLVSSP